MRLSFVVMLCALLVGCGGLRPSGAGQSYHEVFGVPLVGTQVTIINGGSGPCHYLRDGALIVRPNEVAGEAPVAVVLYPGQHFLSPFGRDITEITAVCRSPGGSGVRVSQQTVNTFERHTATMY